MLMPVNKVASGSSGYVKPFIKSFFSLPKSPLEVLKTALTGTVLFFAAAKSPSLWLSLNELSKYQHLAASPIPEESRFLPQQKLLPKEVKNFLWSKEGLNEKNIAQYKQNCQIMANIISNAFTEEGLKRLESLIEVKDYNLDEKNFYINFNVNINGKQIPVSYNDLINDNERFFKNDPHAPHVIAYAIEKELKENYVPNPGGNTALSAATFITNKNYSTQYLWLMSDASLIEVLSKAPNQIITIGTHPELNGVSQTLVDVIKAERVKMGNSSRIPIEPNHECSVKNYKYENGQHLITLVTYNREFTLTLEDLRKSMWTITAESKMFNLFDSRTAEAYLLSLIIIIALRKAITNFDRNRELKNKLV